MTLCTQSTAAATTGCSSDHHAARMHPVGGAAPGRSAARQDAVALCVAALVANATAVRAPSPDVPVVTGPSALAVHHSPGVD